MPFAVSCCRLVLGILFFANPGQCFDIKYYVVEIFYLLLLEKRLSHLGLSVYPSVALKDLNIRVDVYIDGRANGYTHA